MRATQNLRPKDMTSDWLVVDAEDVVLGRLAAAVAVRLRGKHRAHYAPHLDCGDHVIVVNAEKVHLTGRKRSDKIYYRHTGYPGGIRSEVAGPVLEGRHPERVIARAVRRMMPDGPLARQQLRKLKVYAGPVHPHAAQSPRVLDLKAANRKNARSV